MTGEPFATMADEAALWVARMDGDCWSDAAEAELQAWLARDERRRGALLRAQAAWMTLDPPGAADADDRRHRPALGRRQLVLGSGAAVAASVAGGFLWFRTGRAYATEVGEIRRVPLDDGSVVAINTASRIEVDLARRRRTVLLSRGEAWFQVAKDRRRPFVVEAGRVVVQAVGTAFSVRRRAGGADVIVTEGVVHAWAAGADGARVRLAAGQRAFVADNAAVERVATAPDAADRALAWRGGLIDLEGETLADAVAEFNRYNRRKLVLVDPGLAAERFDGVFRIDDPAGFAQAVEAGLDVPADVSSAAEIRIGRPGTAGAP